MNERYNGIIVASITPFNKKGQILFESHRKLIEMNEKKGVKGFYVGGSTGESHLMTLDERKKLAEKTIEYKDKQSVAIIHVGCISTSQTLELAYHAQEIGADAISAITPFYYKFSKEEILNHFKTIMSKCELPMIVYNFPDLCGVNLTVEDITELNECGNFLGVKYTSQDLFSFQLLCEKFTDKIMFNGHDEIMLQGLIAGGQGAIGSTYNFMADIFVDLYNQYQLGNLEEAKQLQRKANRIISTLLSTSNLPGTKYLLERMGYEVGECRFPFAPLEEHQKKILEKMYDQYLV